MVAEAVRAMSKITKPANVSVVVTVLACSLVRLVSLARCWCVRAAGSGNDDFHCFFGYLSQRQSTGHCRRRRCG